MLLRKGKITEEVVELILSWQHSGFNVHSGSRIQPGDDEAMENIARYVVRASFSQERMTHIPEESNVVYRSKDGRSEKTFDALEWLAATCSHVPNKGEQIVRYYGYYSNLCRGRRKKADQDRLVPCILQPEESCKGYRKNWARFTRLWRADPKNRSLSPDLIRENRSPDLSQACPEPVEGCHGPMAIISFIEAEDVIEKILKHLGLSEAKPRPPPPTAKAQPLLTEPYIDYSVSQLPASHNGFYVDPPSCDELESQDCSAELPA